MNTLVEIENAICELPPHELSKLRDWLASYKNNNQSNPIDQKNHSKPALESGFGMLKTDLPTVDADFDVADFATDVI